MVKKLWIIILALVVVAAWGGISHAAVSEEQLPETQQSESSQQPSATTGTQSPQAQPGQTGQQPGTQTGAQTGTGQVLRILTFKTAGPDQREQAFRLANEANKVYTAAKGFQWVIFYQDPSSGELGSVSLWNSQADVEAFLKSDAYKPISEKLKPLAQGAVSSKIYQVYEPAGAQVRGTTGGQTGTATGAGAAGQQQQTQPGQQTR